MVIFAITAGFILLDLVTGIIKAFKQKNFTSSVMREGLYHKAGSLIVVGFGFLVDYAQGFLDLGVVVPIATPICVYIALMEIGSIIENICTINPSILPTKLKNFFQKLKVDEKTEEKEADTIDKA